MRQVWGRPFGLFVWDGVGVGGLVRLWWCGEVRRLILRYAQNDKGRGGAALDRAAGRVILRA